MKNEKLLISRTVLLGDRDAFSRLVGHYQSPVRRFLLKLTLGDGPLADDLAQETFIKAWLNLGSFRSVSRFSTWLFRIAYNTFYDYTRTHRSFTDLNAGHVAARLPYESTDPDEGMDVAKALATLAGDERAAMLLFYMEDMSVENISLVLDIPSGTVKSLLSRGRKKVAAFLESTPYNTKTR